jgi:translation initiation factor 1 (eIF-1/SUI1)
LKARGEDSGAPQEPKRLTHRPFASLRGESASPEVTGSSEHAAPARPGDRVTVRRERAGRGGKTVTIAEGPGLAGRNLAELARGAARALGVGARVEQSALVVQGDQSDRLAAWLTQRGFTSVARGN